MDVNTALEACVDPKIVCQRRQVLKNLGLGYLTLGEETPSLSGGEAQRLKLASEMGKTQSASVFVFDEPTIGIHPLDVQTLIRVFQTLEEPARVPYYRVLFPHTVKSNPLINPAKSFQSAIDFSAEMF